MTKKKSGFAQFLGTCARFVWFAFVKLLRWLFIDSFRTLKEAYDFARHPEKKEMIDRKLDVEHRVELQEDKIKRLERLVYAVYQDPSYSKSDKGQHDLKQIQRGTEK